MQSPDLNPFILENLPVVFSAYLNKSSLLYGNVSALNISIIAELLRKSASVSNNLSSVTPRFVDKNSVYPDTPHPDECHPWLERVMEVSNMYYVPAMIVIGLVGNLLACFVFLQTHLKMRSSSYYLAALAMADFGYLTTLIPVWLSSEIGVEMFNLDGWCQLLVYLSSTCGFLSVWLIVAFTVERFIAVQYPLHRPHMCTVSRAKTIVACLTALSLTLHTYAFFTAGITHHEDMPPVCEMVEKYHEVMRVITIIDSLFSLGIPLVLILLMNTMITWNLVKFSRRFRACHDQSQSDINLHQMPSSSSSSRRTPSQQSYHSSRSNQSRPVPASTRNPSASASASASKAHADQIITPISRNIHVHSSSTNLVSTRTQQSITKMLLLISTVFVLLNLPSYVIRLYIFVGFSLWRQPAPAKLWCMQQIAMLLYYTNFSINFLLYSMCGITFRRCLCQLVRKKLRCCSRLRCDKARGRVALQRLGQSACFYRATCPWAKNTPAAHSADEPATVLPMNVLNL